MKKVNITIDGIPVAAQQGSTILEAAKGAGIRIPTLCYMKEINEIGACRICVVEVNGGKNLVASCVSPVYEGMQIVTNNPAIIESRKTTLELMLSNHNKKCLSCFRNMNCELQRLCYEYGVDEDRFKGEIEISPPDTSSVYIVRDNSKCILCRKCEAVCKERQAVGVIGPIDRGFDTHIGSFFDKGLRDVSCVACGQCIVNCPTGALTEKDDTDKVFAALANPDLHVIVGTAPAVRVALGECFDMAIGTNVKGKMVTALRRMGFKGVFDVDFSADLTVMEEGTEFLQRLEGAGPLPLITSCSPGWIKYCEHYYPEFIPNLSSCKSPQQMFGAIAKTYYAKINNIDPSKIFVVSVMPCTAKKFEITRENESAGGYPDIDVVITTRELGRMIKKVGIEFENLKNSEFDAPMGLSTGAGVIFGATGGVMEAALRTVYELVEKKPLEEIDFKEVRGVEGIKEAEYEIGGKKIKVAVASGLSNAKELMSKIKSGEAKYDFVEIMACPGGCVNGGGQPLQPDHVKNFVDLRAERAKAIYTNDLLNTLRKSHENPSVIELYKNFLGKPGSHKAHEILHTTYVERSKT